MKDGSSATQNSVVNFHIEHAVLEYLSTRVTLPKEARLIYQLRQEQLAAASEELGQILNELAALKTTLQTYQIKYDHCINPTTLAEQVIETDPLSPKTDREATQNISNLLTSQQQLITAYKKQPCEYKEEGSNIERDVESFKAILQQEYKIYENINKHRDALQLTQLELERYQWIEATESLLQSNNPEIKDLSRQSLFYCGFYPAGQNDPNERTATLNQELETALISNLTNKLDDTADDFKKLQVTLIVLKNLDRITDINPHASGSINLYHRLHEPLNTIIQRCALNPVCHELLSKNVDNIRFSLGLDFSGAAFMSPPQSFTPQKDTKKPGALSSAPGLSVRQERQTLS